ncbi:hypothetical protein Tco_1321020, partial [Tanacetum coccineum]
MQAAQDRQKSYADRKRKPREFKIGDRVIPKSSPRRRSELPAKVNKAQDLRVLQYPGRASVILGLASAAHACYCLVGLRPMCIVNFARLYFFTAACSFTFVPGGFATTFPWLGFKLFFSNMGKIDSMRPMLTQYALDALCEKYYIPDVVHPQLPGRNDRIQNSPACKIGFYKMDLFAFIRHADPTKVKIGEREVREGEVLLLELTRRRVISLAGVNDQRNVNVQDAGNDNVNEEGDGAAGADQAEQGSHVVNVGRIDIAADDEIQAIVVDQPKRVRKKRKAVDGASGFGLPPKTLKEDHGISGDVGASTAGKSLVVLQDLLDSITLAAELGRHNMAEFICGGGGDRITGAMDLCVGKLMWGTGDG